MLFRIRCLTNDIYDDEPLYWSNAFGWVDIPSADTFTDEEHTIVMLPFDGVWEPCD